ncbi:hypothetical protein HG536_0D00920 [Torulaspora globosa]|uniref:Shr3 amino acid permease chaperone n=1 Tax=Torulaspora globosa TaxID=48254 RepID=A0A7G3ZGD4_9SACH|nr:uncharacterized protein HG536_0D00920 [Torulaspora globosa]QLL32570.1 hypothetical protein HG536_0D00920 [Torulaspora globosa]
MGLSYKDVTAVGTGLILIGASFIMGVFFANQTYDYNLLFNSEATQEHFDNALKHYQTLFYTAPAVRYILLGVASIGLIGGLIRVYKPNPDLQLFEYCSLGLYVFGICVFITNIKTGIECSITRNWGEVTENQGLAVIASSNIILLLLFTGVIVLQAGLWYTRWEHEQRLQKFYAEEAAAQTHNATEKQNKKQDKKKD